MLARALIDTGPLAAALNRHDHWHSWSRKVFAEWPGPYLTTEANFTEACHLLERGTLKGSLRLYEFAETGLIQIVSLRDSLPEVQAHVARYRDRRVDFADACLLVLCERFPRLPVITTDRADFTIYLRGHGQRLVMP
jgi:predicted nucleic acid-binding protein